MVGWHHRLDGHEFEQALRVGEGQGSLVCCSPWDHKEPTELNWGDLKWSLFFCLLYFVLPPLKRMGCLSGCWYPLPVFRSCFVEVDLSIQMIFWWICGGESGLPILFLQYAGQEATVRTGHWTTDWFQIGKAVRQDCILSPCLFNLYVEYIKWNSGLDEAQAGIKIARNINNLSKWHPPYDRKQRRTKEPRWKCKRRGKNLA